MRAAIVNWEEVAGAVLRNLQHKLAFSPNDRAGHALIAEALSYPGVPEPWRDLDVANPPPPVLTTVMRAGDRQIGFFSTMTSFAMPQDVTLDEVRIECCFPTDDQGRELCARLASEA